MKTYRPKFTALIPDNWVGTESITLHSPEGNANVIASSSLVDPALNTKDYAEAQVTGAQANFPGYRLVMLNEFQVFGSLAGYLHQFDWESDKGPVRQTQLYYVSKGMAWVATATTTAMAYEHVQRQLLEVLSAITGPTD